MFDAFDRLIFSTVEKVIYSLPYANAQTEGIPLGYYIYLSVLLYFGGEIYLLFYRKGKVGK